MSNLIENQITNNTFFSHMLIGFPINKNIGASVGLLPFSNTGYELYLFDTENIDSSLRPIEQLYSDAEKMWKQNPIYSLSR